MSSFFKKHGSIIISISGAVAIMATAWFSKGTEHNDSAWLYAFCIWLFAFSVFEAYAAMTKNKNR